MYSAIIIEPREHPALSFVLYNFIHNLSDEWNFIIFHGNCNLSFINNIIENELSMQSHRITKINLNVDNLTIPEYNNLFIKETILYDNIPTETFLVFQTDTMIFPRYKHLINYFLKYDYVGAPLETPYTNQFIIGNGGLSLRKKSKMLEIQKTEIYSETPEDIFFSCPKQVSIYKPDADTAKHFAIESVLFNEKSFGCHKPWLYLIFYKIINYYPEIIPLYNLNTGNSVSIKSVSVPSTQKLNIVVVYTGNIQNYKSHLISIQNTSVLQHNISCILILGQEYNENIDDFIYISNKIFQKTTVIIIPFHELPNVSNIEDRKQILNQYYKQKSIEYFRNMNYDLVIYTHTYINFNNIINFPNLSNHINMTQQICNTQDHTFVISTPTNMINYMNTNDIYINNLNLMLIEIPVIIIPIINEKYNILYGFHGISEICDSYNYTEQQDNNTIYDFQLVRDYDTIYVTNLNLKKIYKQLMQRITRPFILVSGSADCECPNGIFESDELFNEFINWKHLQHWFCQNSLITHPKITLIPLGLDYHTMMYYTHIRNDRGPKTLPLEQESQIIDLRKTMKPFWDRIPLCYGNFHHLTHTKYGNDRVDAINMIPTKLIYYDSKLERHHTFKNQTSFAFVVSPFGQDYDCIRTWEALCLGCCVIIKTSPLDSLYTDLPILIIKNWTEITEELLCTTISKFKQKHLNNEFKYDKLFKHYWAFKLQEMKDICKNKNIK